MHLGLIPIVECAARVKHAAVEVPSLGLAPIAIVRSEFVLSGEPLTPRGVLVESAAGFGFWHPSLHEDRNHASRLEAGRSIEVILAEVCWFHE